MLLMLLKPTFVELSPRCRQQSDALRSQPQSKGPTP